MARSAACTDSPSARGETAGDTECKVQTPDNSVCGGMPHRPCGGNSVLRGKQTGNVKRQHIEYM